MIVILVLEISKFILKKISLDNTFLYLFILEILANLKKKNRPDIKPRVLKTLRIGFEITPPYMHHIPTPHHTTPHNTTQTHPQIKTSRNVDPILVTHALHPPS